MRNFQRVDEPLILRENHVRWTAKWVKSSQDNTAAKFNWYQFEGRSAREHILPSLAEQTDSHCSFCDAFPVRGVSNEIIEHFRPKSQFPDLAYSWINLYYCSTLASPPKGGRGMSCF